MADGQPTKGAYAFSQDAVQEDVEPAVGLAESPPDEATREELKIRNKLHASGSWSEYPQEAGQATRFPSTVRTHAITYQLFDVSSPASMARYSEIRLCDLEQSRYVFAGPEAIQWDLPNGRCFILVLVEERRFLALKTTDTHPNDT
jgi:hypothetical protein